MSTATAATTPTTTTGRRAGHIALWVLQVLLAAVYLMSAAGKLGADPLQVAGFEAMGLGFQQRLRDGFRALARAHPQRVRLIDGSGGTREGRVLSRRSPGTPSSR